jgi:hypothetical protein
MVAVQRQSLRRLATAIHYRGYFPGSTQAAARTFPGIFPELRDQVGSFSHH